MAPNFTRFVNYYYDQYPEVAKRVGALASNAAASRVLFIAGEPGVGKSSITSNALSGAAKDGRTLAIWLDRSDRWAVHEFVDRAHQEISSLLSRRFRFVPFASSWFPPARYRLKLVSDLDAVLQEDSDTAVTKFLKWIQSNIVLLIGLSLVMADYQFNLAGLLQYAPEWLKEQSSDVAGFATRALPDWRALLPAGASRQSSEYVARALIIVGLLAFFWLPRHLSRRRCEKRLSREVLGGLMKERSAKLSNRLKAFGEEKAYATALAIDLDRAARHLKISIVACIDDAGLADDKSRQWIKTFYDGATSVSFIFVWPTSQDMSVDAGWISSSTEAETVVLKRLSQAQADQTLLLEGVSDRYARERSVVLGGTLPGNLLRNATLFLEPAPNAEGPRQFGGLAQAWASLAARDRRAAYELLRVTICREFHISISEVIGVQREVLAALANSHFLERSGQEFRFHQLTHRELRGLFDRELPSAEELAGEPERSQALLFVYYSKLAQRSRRRDYRPGGSAYYEREAARLLSGYSQASPYWLNVDPVQIAEAATRLREIVLEDLRQGEFSEALAISSTVLREELFASDDIARDVKRAEWQRIKAEILLEDWENADVENAFITATAAWDGLKVGIDAGGEPLTLAARRRASYQLTSTIARAVDRLDKSRRSVGMVSRWSLAYVNYGYRSLLHDDLTREERQELARCLAAMTFAMAGHGTPHDHSKNKQAVEGLEKAFATDDLTGAEFLSSQGAATADTLLYAYALLRLGQTAAKSNVENGVNLIERAVKLYRDLLHVSAQADFRCWLDLLRAEEKLAEVTHSCAAFAACFSDLLDQIPRVYGIALSALPNEFLSDIIKRAGTLLMLPLNPSQSIPVEKWREAHSTMLDHLRVEAHRRLEQPLKGQSGRAFKKYLASLEGVLSRKAGGKSDPLVRNRRSDFVTYQDAVKLADHAIAAAVDANGTSDLTVLRAAQRACYRAMTVAHRDSVPLPESLRVRVRASFGRCLMAAFARENAVTRNFEGAWSLGAEARAALESYACDPAHSDPITALLPVMELANPSFLSPGKMCVARALEERPDGLMVEVQGEDGRLLGRVLLPRVVHPVRRERDQALSLMVAANPELKRVVGRFFRSRGGPGRTDELLSQLPPSEDLVALRGLIERADQNQAEVILRFPSDRKARLDELSFIHILQRPKEFEAVVLRPKGLRLESRDVDWIGTGRGEKFVRRTIDRLIHPQLFDEEYNSKMALGSSQGWAIIKTTEHLKGELLLGACMKEDLEHFLHLERLTFIARAPDALPKEKQFEWEVREFFRNVSDAIWIDNIGSESLEGFVDASRLSADGERAVEQMFSKVFAEYGLPHKFSLRDFRELAITQDTLAAFAEEIEDERDFP